jgi:host factor-I protein
MPFRGKENPHGSQKGRAMPAVETSQEAQYLKTLGETQTAVSIKLVDGEVVKGWIEYYDHDMLRLTRDRAPNLFIFKHDILYVAEDIASKVQS